MIYCNAFFPQLVRTKVADLLLVQMIISGENYDLCHIFQDVARICDCEVQYPHTLLETLDSSVPEHNPHNEDNYTNNCNHRFQTEMETKRQNLPTAALNI